jgi:hypothetical protein
MGEFPEIEPTRQSPAFYFDTASGTILVGEVAMRDHIESGHHPQDVRELGDLLRDTGIDIGPNDYPTKLEIESWQRSDYLDYGHWLVKLTRHDEAVHTLNRDTLVRAGYLGIGPRVARFTSRLRFGSLSQYYQELGIDRTHKVGLYDEWTQHDFIEYATDLVAEIGRKPNNKILWERHRAGLSGPSPYLIYQRFGSLGTWLEFAGFPNIHAWEETDYIEWGVKFMLANDGRLPTARGLNKLSSLKRGPSSRVVLNHFDKLSFYQKLTAEAYEIELDRRESLREYKLQSLQDSLETGDLPAELFADATSECDLITRSAKYQVATQLLPHTEQSVLSRLAGLETAQYLRALCRRDETLTVGDIESTALMLDVFDDIWVMDDYMKTLRVSGGEPG